MLIPLSTVKWKHDCRIFGCEIEPFVNGQELFTRKKYHRRFGPSHRLLLRQMLPESAQFLHLDIAPWGDRWSSKGLDLWSKRNRAELLDGSVVLPMSSIVAWFRTNTVCFELKGPTKARQEFTTYHWWLRWLPRIRLPFYWQNVFYSQ